MLRSRIPADCNFRIERSARQAIFGLGALFREWPVLFFRVAYFGQYRLLALSVFDPECPNSNCGVS
jgi:hypothetical protein